MNKLSVASLCFVALASTLSGCASTTVRGDNASGNPTFFAGTKLNLAALREDSEQLAIYAKYGILPPENPLLDLPASLVFDTFAFPGDFDAKLNGTSNRIWRESASAAWVPTE